MSRVFPLATIDDLEQDLADTDRAIARIDAGYIVDRERMEERLQRLNRWRDKIVAQLAAMKSEAAA